MKIVYTEKTTDLLITDRVKIICNRQDDTTRLVYGYEGAYYGYAEKEVVLAKEDAQDIIEFLNYAFELES